MGERSGLCHGPGCGKQIMPWSASEDFCSHDCQTRWHADANGSQSGVFQRDGLWFMVDIPTTVDTAGRWRAEYSAFKSVWLDGPTEREAGEPLVDAALQEPNRQLSVDSCAQSGRWWQLVSRWLR